MSSAILGKSQLNEGILFIAVYIYISVLKQAFPQDTKSKSVALTKTDVDSNIL